MQNKTIIIVFLAFIIGFFMGYMLRPSLDTEGQSAAVQKTVPITAPLQITATPVYTYNQPTTLTWSSPAHLNLTNCQGTSTDISGNTIPTSWNGAHGSLNITNSFQATMNVPVPINKVVFKIQCQNSTGSVYMAQAQTTITSGSNNLQISISPASLLPGGPVTVSYSYSNMTNGTCYGTASPAVIPATQDWTSHVFTGAANSGTLQINPPGAIPGYVTIYGLHCMGSSGGFSDANAAVIVRNP